MMLKTQNITSSDYNLVIDQLNDWWGGRQMTDMLPRLFFKHFQESSFIIKDKEQVLGFLIGFISQSNPQIAYVHFIGVNPNFRNKHIGRTLYSTFF
ncbi:MAG: GNAT family N-acetyltransferase [Flavobacteriales bacterium]|nr:GNAT family N-acetyltransferase [Flavobacteriales bacterium]